MTMKRSNEKGVALILALILVFVLSVLAVSIMFLSQSETWASMNYRMMTQARYGAEAGLNATANYLANIYVGPPSVADPIANYTLTTWPVQSGGQVVYLTNIPGDPLPTNYPAGAGVITPFNTNSQGTVQSGNVNVNYNSSATLLSMYVVNVFDSPNPQAIQTWQITSTGSIAGVRNAQVQVSAIMEKEIWPTFQYATFGKSNGCGSLTFGGGAYTNSYDSALAVGGVVATQNYGGNAGSNGNLNENGAPTTINGTFSTPRTGVGSCAAGGVNAWTDNGNARVTGCVSATCTPCQPSATATCMNRLSQNVNYPPPTVPPPGTTNVIVSGTQSLLPGSYGDIVLNGHDVLNLYPGVYNINSINDSGANTMIVINPVPGSVPPVYAPVILNVTGNGIATPVYLTGNSLQNPSLVAANFQIVYAGTGTIAVRGGSQAAGVIYAPNAAVSLSGGSDWYGSAIGNTVNVQGGTGVHYDRELNKTAYTVGNWMLDSFNWSKF